MIVTKNTHSGPGIPPSLESRWRRLGIHRASRSALPKTWPTGWPRLDALLPGGGYPVAAVTEFLTQQAGQGELTLLLAGLKPRLDARPEHRLVFIEPPYQLNAPALDAAGIDRSRVPIIYCRDVSERIWSIKQLAAAGGFVAFVLWCNDLDTAGLRQLQLAGEKAQCPVFVYRDLACARRRSPAALRLAVTCHQGRQQIEIIKCRGPAGARATGLMAGRTQPWRSAKNNPAAHIAIQTAENEADFDAAHTCQTRPEPTSNAPTNNAKAIAPIDRAGTNVAISSEANARYAKGQ